MQYRVVALLTTGLAAVLAMTLAVAASAHATTITQGGSFSVIFPAPAGNSHLAADATFTLVSLSSTQAVLELLIHNTSSGDVGFTDRLTALGFLMSPTPTANSALTVTFVSGTNAFTKADTPDAIPSFGGENVCAFVGNNCSAGNAGLTAGQTNDFKITFAGNFNTAQGIDFGLIAIKWTDCTGCSFEIQGSVRTPEPSTLLLLGIGLLAFSVGGVWRRYRRPIRPAPQT